VKRELSFLFPLSPEIEDRLRVRAVKEKGIVLSFVVQYEAMVGGQWREIVRYDTHHGFAHKDIIHPNGRKDKLPLLLRDYNAAFTFSVDDLKASWQWDRHGYEMEMKNE
jgi:hypothetical protein